MGTKSTSIKLINKGLGSDTKRIHKTSSIIKLLRRPELGVTSSIIFVYFIFFILAGSSGMFSAEGMINIFQVSAELGILAAAAALLMISGEFDLSMGSMIAFASICIGICVSQFQIPLSISIALTFTLAILIGWFNGWLVVKTGLPSFIVTLASMFILRGLSVGLARSFTGSTQIPYITEGAEQSFSVFLFSGHVGKPFFIWLSDNHLLATRPDGSTVIEGIPISLLWWILLTIIASWVLLKTRFGNWIFAVGGNINAARNMGIPVHNVKIILFIITALASTLFATIQVTESGSADTLRGMQKEFEAIIAVVIGGTLLTGGYGTTIGAMLGALIFGTVQIGIFYTGIDNDWFKVFLGIMILVAVLFNTYVRRRALLSH